MLKIRTKNDYYCSISHSTHKDIYTKSDDLCLYKAFIFIFLMCGAGDAVKPDTFVLNCQLFRTKIQPFTQNSLPHARASNTKHQTQNRCAPHRPWQFSFWPKTTTNQQSRGTSLSRRMIATSPYNFYHGRLLSSCIFLEFGKNCPTPWP